MNPTDDIKPPPGKRMIKHLLHRHRWRRRQEPATEPPSLEEPGNQRAQTATELEKNFLQAVYFVSNAKEKHKNILRLLLKD